MRTTESANSVVWSLNIASFCWYIRNSTNPRKPLSRVWSWSSSSHWVQKTTGRKPPIGEQWWKSDSGQELKEGSVGKIDLVWAKYRLYVVDDDPAEIFGFFQETGVFRADMERWCCPRAQVGHVKRSQDGQKRARRGLRCEATPRTASLQLPAVVQIRRPAAEVRSLFPFRQMHGVF